MTKVLAAAGAVLLFAVAAPAHAEAFADFGFGMSFTENTDVDIELPSRGTDLRFHEVSFADESLTGWPPWYEMRAGLYAPSLPWLGLSVSLLHFKIIAETEATTHVTGTRDNAALDDRVPMNTIV